MAGFIQRAKRLRRGVVDSSDSSPPQRGVDSGAQRDGGDETNVFPEEEKRGILAEIDRIVAENKFNVTPQSFTVSTKRTGARFPLLVNLIALAVLAGGVYAMLELYREEEQIIRSGGGVVLTTESRLIAELQRRTDEQLQQKEQEISAIQVRLAEVQSERSAIEAEIEQRVQELERELRAEMDAELEAERQRLINEGLSEEEIERLLRDFERRRLAELRAEVEAYREALERRQQENTQALAMLEIELSRSLEERRRERTALIEDARLRESELRARYEERLASRSEEAATAQRQLGELEQLRERESLVQHQITGYYQRIRGVIAASDYAAASQTINQFREFLNQDAVRSLPMMQNRYDAEQYILESLARLVEPQIGAEERSSGDLLARVQLLDGIAELLEAAARAREDGDSETAEELAGEAFALLPQGAAMQQFLAERDHRLIIENTRDELDALMQARLSELAAEYERHIAELEQELARIEQSRDQALVALEEAEAHDQPPVADVSEEPDQPAPDAAPADLAADRELLAELSRLRQMEQELEELQSAYEKFRMTEAQIVGAGVDPFSLIEGKLLLDSFLRSSGVQKLFPELDQHIRRYDHAFQATGRRAAISDTIEIVYTLAGYTNESARRDYLLQERSRASDPQLSEFLDELVMLIDNS